MAEEDQSSQGTGSRVGQNAQRRNSFVFLGREAKRRFFKPATQVNFWGYLVLAILLLGGLPIYVEAYRFITGIAADGDGLRLAFFTVFPAIMGSSAVQLVLDKDNSPIRMAGLLSLVACFLLTLFFITGFADFSDSWIFFWGAVLCILAVLTWWVANGLDPIWEDTIKPDAPVGGDPQANLSGNLEGITS